MSSEKRKLNGTDRWGGWLLMVVMTVLGAAIAVTVITLAWPEEGAFTPITVSNVIVNSRLENIEGAAVHAGENYNGTIEICNSSSSQLTITFIIQLERLSGPVHFVSIGTVEFPVEPGCSVFTGDSAPLPDRITPGMWRESSSATVKEGDRVQIISFVSDPFEVVK